MKLVKLIWSWFLCILGNHDYRITETNGKYRERECQNCNKKQVKNLIKDHQWHNVQRSVNKN